MKARPLYYIAHLLLEEIVVSIEYQCQQNTNPIIFLLCSIEGRNETFFRDWPPKPVENEDEGIVQRDPRLFPIRTPQPPRRPQLYSSQYFLDEYLGEFQVNYNFCPLCLSFQYYVFFQRSSSARLRSKTPQNETLRRQQDQQRDESMRRLLEWKQRMLQSPLSRKGSSVRLDSSGSPKPNSRVGRKTSSASRTSRARSLSRLSNRISSTSSSDEGKKTSTTKSELSKGLSDLALSHKSLENVFVFTASQQLVYYLISGLRSIGQMVIH